MQIHVLASYLTMSVKEDLAEAVVSDNTVHEKILQKKFEYYEN